MVADSRIILAYVSYTGRQKTMYISELGQFAPDLTPASTEKASGRRGGDPFPKNKNKYISSPQTGGRNNTP